MQLACRKNLAAALARSERTVSRYAARGWLKVRRGPFHNSPMRASLTDVERLRRWLEGEEVEAS